MRTEIQQRWIGKTVFIFIIIYLSYNYIGITASYIENIPCTDEFDFALKWLIDHQAFESNSKKFQHLFSQANSHRLFSYNAALLLDYTLFGEINFERIIWYGHLGLVVIMFLLFNLVWKRENRYTTLIVISFLFIIPMHEISNWSIMTFAAFVEYALVLGALICLSRTGSMMLVISIILAFIATFSFGNGMFVFPAGFFIILFSSTTSKPKLLGWTVAMMVSVALYFVEFKTTTGSTDVVLLPWNIIKFFLIFLGGLFSSLVNQNLTILTVLGALLFIYFLWLSVFQWKKICQYPVETGMILFVLMSGAAAALFRTKFGLEIAASSRYELSFVFFIAMLMILTLNITTNNKRLQTFFLTTSVLLFIQRSSILEANMQSLQQYLKDTIFFYNEERSLIRSLPIPEHVFIKRMDLAEKLNIYKAPKSESIFPEVHLEQTKLDTAFHSNSMNISVDFFREEIKTVEAKGWAFPTDAFNEKYSIKVVFSGNSASYWYSVTPIFRPDVRKYFNESYSHIPIDCGFKFIITKDRLKLPAGSYAIGIGITTNKNGAYFQNTGHCIDL